MYLLVTAHLRCPGQNPESCIMDTMCVCVWQWHGISLAKCNSAPWPRHVTTPAYHHSVFYRLGAIPATQPTASKHWRHKNREKERECSWQLKSSKTYAGRRARSLNAGHDAGDVISKELNNSRVSGHLKHVKHDALQSRPTLLIGQSTLVVVIEMICFVQWWLLLVSAQSATHNNYYYYYYPVLPFHSLGQPGWAATRRKIHPLTPTVVINHPLPASSIYFNPCHPPCSIYVPDSLFPQSLSTFYLVYLFIWHSPLHTPYISSPNYCLLFAAHAHTIAICFCYSSEIMSSNPSLSEPITWNSQSCSLRSHIHLNILISAS